MDEQIQIDFNERKLSTLFNGNVVGNNHQLPTSDFVAIGQDPRELIHAILFRPENNIIITGASDNEATPIQHTVNLRGKSLYIDQNNFTGVHITRANDISQMKFADWVDTPNQAEIDDHPGIGNRQVSYTHYQWQESELGLTCFATMNRGQFDSQEIETSGGVIYHFGIWPDGSFANEMQPNVIDPAVMETLTYLTKDSDGRPFYSSEFISTFTYMTGFFYHGLDNFNFYVIRHNTFSSGPSGITVGNESTIFMYRIDGAGLVVEYPTQDFDGISYVLHPGKSDDSEALMMTSFEPVTPTIGGSPTPGYLQRIHFYTPSTMALDFETPPVINFIDQAYSPQTIAMEFDISPGKILSEKQTVTNANRYFRKQSSPAFNFDQFGYKSPYSPQYILDDKDSYTTTWLDESGGDNIFTYSQIRDVYEENNNTYFVNAAIPGFPTYFLFDFNIWPIFPPKPIEILSPRTLESFPNVSFSPGFFNGDDWNFINRRYSTRLWNGMIQEPNGPAPTDNYVISVGFNFQPDLQYDADSPGNVQNGYQGRNHLFTDGFLRNIIYDSIQNDINSKPFCEGCNIQNSLLRSSLLNTNYIAHNSDVSLSWFQDSFGGIGQALATKEVSDSIFTDIENPTGDGNTHIFTSTFNKCGVVGNSNGYYEALIISLGLSPNGATWIDNPSPTSGTFKDCVIQPDIITGIPLPSASGYDNLLVANPQFINPFKPYNLRLKSVAKGYALDSPALGYSTNIISQFGGPRDAGAYDDRNAPASAYERVLIEAPYEAKISTDAKTKINVIESGRNAIGKVSKTYIPIVFQWKLTMDEKEREKIWRILNADITAIKYYPKPYTNPDLVLTGNVKLKSEISNIKAQIEGFTSTKLTLSAVFEAPTDEINQYL